MKLFSKNSGHDSRGIANIFIDLTRAAGRSLTINALNKYVYFAHGWTLGYTGKPLICHKVEAWKFGPIVPEIYSAHEGPGYRVRGSLRSLYWNRPYTAKLTSEEEIIVNNVFKDYVGLDSSALARIAQREDAPWHEYKGRFYEVIPNEKIKAYYQKLIENMRARELQPKEAPPPPAQSNIPRASNNR